MTTVETGMVQGTTAYTGLPGTFTCYKLVCQYDDEARVWCSLSAFGDGRVYYHVGDPAKAPGWLAVQGYHLTAFETLAQAVRYWSSLELRSDRAVFECEALYREPLPPRTPPWCIATRGPLTPFAVPFQGWPEGTVMAQRLTLLRRIPEEALHDV